MPSVQKENPTRVYKFFFVFFDDYCNIDECVTEQEILDDLSN